MGLPGLQKLNIPQNKSTSSASKSNGASELKHVAARNLATTSRASGATSYGIFAQRSPAGTGAIFSPKQTYGSAIDAQRAYMNANRTIVGNNFYGGHNCSGNYDNGMNKFMAGMMALNMLGELTAQTINAVKSTKSTEGAGGNDKTATTTSSSTKSLNEMKSADNSTALEAALSKATKDQAAIPEKISTASSELTQLKGQTAGLKGKYEEAQTTLDNHNKAISETSANVNELKGSVSTAETAYNVALQNLDRLKAMQGSSSLTPEAKTALDINLRRAEQEVTNKKTQLDKLNDSLEQKQQELKDLNAKTNDLKQAVGDAKDAYDKNLKDVETKQKEIDQLEQDKADLEKEIPKQKERLTKLQKKEDEELSTLGGKITKLSNEASNLINGINVNDEDGLSKKDQKNKVKADKKNAEVDGLKERQAKLQRQKAIRNLPIDNVPGNTQFKSGLAPTGEMMYVVDGKEVTKEEYEQKKAELMSQT